MHTHSRRGFLCRTLGPLWTGASLLEQSMLRAAQATSAAKTQPAYTIPRLFDFEKVAEGVWAAIARPTALINSNAAIFENASDVLIVDAHSKPSAVVSLVSYLRKEITTKPVRYVVNSHFHWDHTQGTPAYKRIAPHADVVASAATRRLLAENAVTRLKASVEEAQRTVQSYKEKRAAARADAEKTYYDRMITETGEYIREMRNYAPELPDVTLDRDLIIHDKAHDLHLAFRGRGHTAGDVVVFCPQKKVIATGDLLHGFAPYLADGYPLEWPRTLLFAAEFEFEHVIGGHGAVQHTRDRLYQMGNYIEELADRVVQGKRAGKTVAQLQSEIQPASLKSLASGGYGEFFSSQRLKHTPQPPGTTAAALLAEAVQTNTAHIYAALERS